MSGSVCVRVGGVSFRFSPRTVVVGCLAIAVLLALSVATLLYGTLHLTPMEVLQALWGQGEPSAVRTVRGRRLPRLVTAALVGALLGSSGALMQSVSRNPLGSPDIMGLTGGAAAGAIAYLTLGGHSVTWTAIAAVVGGLVTAAAVYGLARRDGVTGGIRLILVGIGVGAITSAITSAFVVRAELDRAANAQMWRAGNLTGRGWPHALSVLAVWVLLLGPSLVLSRRLNYLALGDDMAIGVGLPAERTRLLAIGTSVVSMAVAVAATGPISFVALASPQVARRLTRRPGVQVLPAMLVGANLVVLADLVSQAVNVGARTPVGTVSALVGGIYLIWLLARRS